MSLKRKRMLAHRRPVIPGMGNTARMGKREFSDAIDARGMTQVASARFLGFAPRTVREWVAGKADIPQSVAIVLRLMLALDLTTERTAAIVRMKWPKEEPNDTQVDARGA
jgi:hypothetical protein